ncbi:hypothetical protein ZIOFF_026814 [Zingiber officinale]|uniref:ENHANCER OF AG-4 protein 2 n=1 Tax=Zingiber officinale TaxID=94328 RepID=A0A8J5GXZ4_ZINOF|nr:hypothetical protein ZIOFF_026814 [Zingiber officinale]
MAPGRKKGSNRVKAVGQLKLGDLVLAKVKGYPAWPAKISKPEDFERPPDPRKYFVQFFGTNEIHISAFVVPADIQIFTDESKSKLIARCQGKTVKHFASAVEEICEAFEELNKKQSVESVASPSNSDLEDIKHPVEHSGVSHLKDLEKKVENNTSGEPLGVNVDSRSQEACISLDPSSTNLNGSESLLKRKKSSTNDGQIAKKKKPVVSKSDLYPSSHKEKLVITSSDDNKDTNIEILPELEIGEPLPKVSAAGGHHDCNDSKSESEHHGKDVSHALQENDGIVAMKKKVLVSKSSFFASGKKKKSTSARPDEIKNTDIQMLSKMEPKGLDLGELDNSCDLKDASKSLKVQEVRAQAVMRRKVFVSKSSSSTSSSNDKLMSINPDDINNEDMIMSPKMETEDLSPKGSAGGFQDHSDSKGENDNEEGDASNAKVLEVGHQTTKVLTEPKQNVDGSGIKSSVALRKQLKGSSGKGNKLSGGKNTKVTSHDSNRESSRNTASGSDSKTSKLPKSLKILKENSFQKGKMHNDPSCTNDHSVASSDVEENFKGRSKKHKFDGSNDSGPAKRAKLVKEDQRKKSMQGDLFLSEKTKKSRNSILIENQFISPTNNDAHVPTVKHAEDMDAGASSAAQITESSVQTDSKLVKKHDRPLSTHIRYKRRSCRIDDDDEVEEIKTPIHKTCSGNLVLSDSGTSVSEQKCHPVIESNKDSPTNKDVTEKAGFTSDQKSSDGITLPINITEKNERKAEKSQSPQTYQSPTKREYQKCSFGDSRTSMLSPKASSSLDEVSKLTDQTSVKPHVKTFDSSGRKSQITPSKFSKSKSESLHLSTNQSVPEKNKALNKSINMKAPSKSNSHNTALTENKHEKRVSSERNTGKDALIEKRSGLAKEEKLISVSESSFSDSSKSMKHLIAVAQAKRKETQSRYVHPENPISVIVSTPNLIHGMSPSPAALIPFISANLANKDMKGAYAAMPSDSPYAVPHESSLTNKVDHEEYEHRISPEYRPAGGSLSGGTEAAVARDALEGMVETLSRTKDSIGRATRLAIDCAKYGIAGEVVELLIQKLESEPSFHRRVDLLFLIDSITQCSHTHKGIAGSSYIPAVQEALPRLLNAAAPAGASARENRRQCLKVLRLWLERKIMPDSLLRRYIDDIEIPNDDLSAGVFLKRPSRAERSVDDPIREMEGMQVDEYGSNATFQLPGFLSCRVFEDEEDTPVNIFSDSGIKMPVETASKLEDLDSGAVTPNDRHHHILKDVDGELEMEDCNQAVHLSNNTMMQGQEAALGNEVVLQQRPNFMANGMSNTQSMNSYSSSRPFEYGQNESYLAPQASHHIRQFQQGNTPFHQIPYPSLPPYAPTAGQTAGHFSHATPMSQQPVQQQYNPYPLPSVSNSHRQYLADEQRRVHTSGFSPDNQHSAWVSTARPSCSGASIVQDGFPRSNIEMPPPNSMGFQLPLHNSVPSAGHNFPQVLPGRPDISGLNCWRPDLFYDVWELEMESF